MLFLAMRSHHHYQQQQQHPGKPAGEFRMTSPAYDKENIVTSSQRRSSSRSIFGCVELLAETSCDRPPSHFTVLTPYLVTHVDQSASSHYRHVTSSPAALLANMTSPPVACQTPVLEYAVCRKRLLWFSWQHNRTILFIDSGNMPHKTET